MRQKCLVLLVLVNFAESQLVPEPTRPINLWDPFGESTTVPPRGQGFAKDEVLVRLPLGDLIGKEIKLYNLPWTPTQDPTEQLPRDGTHFDPNPLHRHNNFSVYTFLGVPYAEPPVSQRRFKPPQQLRVFPGKGPYLALQYGAACAQDVESRPQPIVNEPYPFIVDEDCLYLNIFSPDVSRTAPTSYPVVVFFHGGNFQSGSANEWPGHGLASRGMVVVTVNYRLGAFGFMSLGDSETGNYGLQDQRVALEFVRDHIASFGGDPQAVTVIGHDAGAASIGFHMQSPYSRNLFRSAAAMSGAEVSYHSYIGKPALAFNNTIKLGRYLGCSQSVPTHVWDCILTRSTNDIVRATTTIPIEYNRYLFMPTVDGKYVPGNPFWTLLNAPSGSTQIMSPVPLLLGMNAQDGSEVVLEDRYLGEFNDFNNVDNEYMKSYTLEYCFRHNYSMNREALAEAIIDRYTFWPDRADVWAIRAGFIQLVTDAYYTAPISLSAHLHSSSGSRVFMYVNNYNFSKGSEQFRFIPDWMGVCRECDLFLLFGYPWMPPELRYKDLAGVTFTELDQNASQTFSNIFRRFTYYQNPNFLYDGSWAAYEPRRHWYMNFNYTWSEDWKIPGRIDRDYRFQDVAFWNEYIPSLVNYMTTTFPPSEVSVRRQLVVFQWLAGVFIIVIALLIVLAGAFGYQVFEKSAEKDRNKREEHHLVEVLMAPTQKKAVAPAKAKVAKAVDAKKKVVKGAKTTRTKKVRTSVHFRRPKTLKTARAPRFPRKSVPDRCKLDAFSIVKHPLTTESAMKKIEDNNTLVFIVDVRANKHQIKQAVKKLYNVTVQKVNTLITPLQEKKAYVRLTADYDALDVANKIGVI
ncbi:unnamed protein product [Caenorhabditis auriculariae]|uniref:Uncharacterized protein n=1 Tax=Caenorhabditis auriculariae TaxID=2777116 RepID=A0A8S1GW09_9PELO|nr:unnamed protein product [Caenorhabditis auriculariae]